MMEPIEIVIPIIDPESKKRTANTVICPDYDEECVDVPDHALVKIAQVSGKLIKMEPYKDGDEKEFMKESPSEIPPLSIEKYLTHLPSCVLMQDWSEFDSAMTDLAKFRDTAWEQHLEEVNKKMTICSCGLTESLTELKETIFTPDQIRKVQELAYDAGFNAEK